MVIKIKVLKMKGAATEAFSQPTHCAMNRVQHTEYKLCHEPYPTHRVQTHTATMHYMNHTKHRSACLTQLLSWQMPGMIPSVLGLVGPVSIFCERAWKQVWSATSTLVWQHVNLSSQTVPDKHYVHCLHIQPPKILNFYMKIWGDWQRKQNFYMKIWGDWQRKQNFYVKIWGDWQSKLKLRYEDLGWLTE